MGSARRQGEVWGARAIDWANANEPAWSAVFDEVLERTGVGPGCNLLDVGCGAGGTLVRARQQGANVTGLDAAEALVRIARERLPDSEIAVGEMEELPFADQRFDVVTGVNAFQFAESPVRALGEAGRVCRGGGTVAMLVWGKPEDCDLLSRVMPAVIALLPPPAADAPPMTRMSEPGVIEALIAKAGLVPGNIAEFSGSLQFDDLDMAVRAVMSASARAIAHSGESRVRDAVGAVLAKMRLTDGSVVLHNRFVLAMASPK